MARILWGDQGEERDAEVIRARLAPLGIALQTWPLPADPEGLLARPDLDSAERERVLEAVEHRFLELQAAHGYQSRDLIVLHEGVPGLDAMLQKFDSVHYHEDDEVRYVLAGRGYFGFVEADGSQFLLEVESGDYINVPARTEHWFEMKDSRRIKAVRYFIDKAGWVPVYTERRKTA
ncbi:MAG TPA: cupin domain-containing protein [Acidiferrobacteraceae bacterium]|nr:cupin domain-containing protein [Acidiferrobacteraceae bacterium]